ncbi:unnamed protein product [Cladocopium goreaui]|uniref:VTT domain-containing protein n=1 Tax=Cladocopium goreaui TaxID=2562237 RepID=A0A9P1CEK3_9DINO|nr:unnamed protein product [Cladocopium goreaui]
MATLPSMSWQTHRGHAKSVDVGWARQEILQALPSWNPSLRSPVAATFTVAMAARKRSRRCFRLRESSAIRATRSACQVLLVLMLMPSCAFAFDGASLASAAVEVMRDGPLGPAPFMLVHLAAIVVCFPGTAAFELAAGAVFGFLPGVLAVAITKGAAAAVTFFLARRFGVDAAGTLQRALRAGPANLDSWSARLRRGVQGNAFRFCLLARLSPIPSWVNNYALPLADVPFETFLPATLLGMLPPLTANVYSGACALSLASALTGGGTVDGGSLVLGALSALSGAAILQQMASFALDDDTAANDAGGDFPR